MRSGTNIQSGDWLKVRVDEVVIWRVIYRGTNPISHTCSTKNFPWQDCLVLSKEPQTNTLPFRKMKNSAHAPFNVNKITGFEITAPFAYP